MSDARVLAELCGLAKILCYNRGLEFIGGHRAVDSMAFVWRNQDGRYSRVVIEARYWLNCLSPAANELMRHIEESDKPLSGVVEGAGELL